VCSVFVGEIGTPLAPILDKNTIEFLENTCIFCQPWWLQAVSPDSWDIAVARRGEEVAAVLPYAYKTRLGRFRLIEFPFLTFYLGPWLRQHRGKYANTLGEEKELMKELIEQLPEFASFHQWFHPAVTNWLPFYWKGFRQTTRYTYVIEDTSDPELVWAETRENIRTDIRKARKQVEVIEDTSIDRFLAQQKATFLRQNKPLPYPEATLRVLDAECVKRGSRKILLAVDPEGNIHASAYLVWDKGTVYSLLRGSDPALRNSGSTSLVVWKAIEFASTQGKRFDFAGSWHESIERFVRAFGGKQMPFFEVSKLSSLTVKVYRMLWRWTHHSGWSSADLWSTLSW
jgi:hypothetical protein